jgi:monoamine oxidase
MLHQLITSTLRQLAAQHTPLNFSRRRFLHTSAMATVVASTTGIDYRGLLAKPRVGIVGAGMAGLSAAWHLKQRGIEAKVFEASERVGGRISTVRLFGNGALTTELGAEFIDTNHADMLFFVEKMGLQGKLLDVTADPLPVKEHFFIANRSYSVKNIVDGLTAAYPDILQKRKELGKKKTAKSIDQLVLADYIASMPIDSWLQKLLHVAYTAENGLDTGEQSAANMLSVLEADPVRGFLPYGESDERFKLMGGNDQIPKALGAVLEHQIYFEHRLYNVKERANKTLELTFKNIDTTHQEAFDYVILAIPFTQLRQVDFEMELPPLKKQVIAELGYGTNSKYVVETISRPWRAQGFQGYVFNEVFQNGWDSSHLQANNEGAGTFTLFFGGKLGREAQKEPLEQSVVPAAHTVFNGMKATMTPKRLLANWAEHPFSGASYSCMKVGQATYFKDAAFAPVRHLLFAGEHCSTDYWGFMNGAAETGRRAAAKVK